MNHPRNTLTLFSAAMAVLFTTIMTTSMPFLGRG